MRVPIRTLEVGTPFEDPLGRRGTLVQVTPTGARVAFQLPRQSRSFTTRWGDAVAFTAPGSKELTISAETEVTPLPVPPREADIAQVRRTMEELGMPQAEIEDEVRRMRRVAACQT